MMATARDLPFDGESAAAGDRVDDVPDQQRIVFVGEHAQHGRHGRGSYEQKIVAGVSVFE
jgi:hypothetical protein